MPGGGPVKEHPAYSSVDAATIGQEAAAILGAPIDVMLNEFAMWRAVPKAVA